MVFLVVLASSKHKYLLKKAPRKLYKKPYNHTQKPHACSAASSRRGVGFRRRVERRGAPGAYRNERGYIRLPSRESLLRRRGREGADGHRNNHTQ